MQEINHHEHQERFHSKNALILAISVSAVIFVMELVGGIWTNSLALLSDSGHVFMDLLSFALSLCAIRLAERPISDSRTFGWHRMEVFAALLNGFSVFIIAMAIFVHAAKRITQPEIILGPQMLAIAAIGLVGNLYAIWKLHPHGKGDLNVRSAILHAVGDAAASVAVIGGGVLVLFTGKNVIDPIAAIAVALIIIFNAYEILRDSFQILLEGMPKGLDRNLIVGSVEEITGKETIRDLHVWSLCSHICALSAHLILPENKMDQQKNILSDINLKLREKFNIVHTTIQIESDKWQERKGRELE